MMTARKMAMTASGLATASRVIASTSVYATDGATLASTKRSVSWEMVNVGCQPARAHPPHARAASTGSHPRPGGRPRGLLAPHWTYEGGALSGIALPRHLV